METTAIAIHNKVYANAIFAKEMELVPEINENERRIAQDMENLGFGNSIIVKQNRDKVFEKSKAESRNKFIMWLNQKLQNPNYKVITFGNLVPVLTKYNLFIGRSCRYTKEIPTWAAKKVLEHSKLYRSRGVEGHISNFPKTIDGPNYFVCAPFKDFEKPVTLIGRELCWDERLRKPTFKIEFHLPSPDPIIISPLIYTSCGHNVLLLDVVTAWDREASDPMIVNETMN